MRGKALLTMVLPSVRGRHHCGGDLMRSKALLTMVLPSVRGRHHCGSQPDSAYVPPAVFSRPSADGIIAAM